MESYNIALTLGVGVLASAALFFLFYKVLKRPGKLSALLTVLVTQAIYIPLAATHWAGLDVFAIHFGFFTMTAVILSTIVTAREQGHLRFHWAVGVLIGFFVVLAIVDATIITLANSGASAEFMRRFLPEPRQPHIGNVTSAFPGTVANNYQKQYAEFNNHLQQVQAQRERGWQVTGDWQGQPQLGYASLFSVKAVDKAGQAVEGAEAVVQFQRPSDKRLDQRVVLAESAPGIYSAAIPLPAPGQWEVLVTLKRGADVHELRGKTWVEAAPKAP